MPKTPPPRRGASSRRSAPTKVSKPFPWGVVAGSGVLAVALVGLLVYAALNQGGGRNRLLTDPDDAISGITVSSKDQLSRNHVEGTVKYPTNPPTGGDHNSTPQTCQVYTEAIAPEHAVHSLEHGAVWVTYNDKATEGRHRDAHGAVQGDPYRLMSPAPTRRAPITLTAWGRQLDVKSADDKRVEQFLDAYTNGPQTPEKGAGCVGTTATGPLATHEPGGADPGRHGPRAAAQ